MTDTIAAPPVPPSVRAAKHGAASMSPRPRPRRACAAAIAPKRASRPTASSRSRVTTVFLVVLLADILMRGLPAFWQHSVVLDVPVKAEEIDPDNKRAELAPAGRGAARRAPLVVRAPAARAQARRPRARSAAADPGRRLLRPRPAGALRCLPGRRGAAGAQASSPGSSRTGAGDRLRDQVVADVGLIGQTVRDRPAAVGQCRSLPEGRGHAVRDARTGAASRRRAAPPARSPF